MEVTAEDLGKRSFCEAVMRARLPKAVFKELKKTIDYGAPLDAAIADSVAIAMREWAKELGATHYTHWFHPLTNLTAEKHDSFMDPVGDGTFITEFTGKELIKAEPDGSSFPSGGIRETCAARGYTVWDCTSPAFVKEIPDGCKVLCIPTIFISYTGESLDHKTPLLRSMDAVNKQALRILKLFGKTPAKVTASVGPEQEYFLIDKDKFNQRLDLKLTGRTLFGAPAPKGQELDDQYFGVIKSNVIIGILASAVLYYLFMWEVPSFDMSNISQSFKDFAKVGFLGVFNGDAWDAAFNSSYVGGVFSGIMLIVAFCLVDMFDTIGTIYGTAASANMLDENGDPISMNECMLCDSIGTVSGALLGTSTCTTFVESASGVGAGGRTGFTSIITALCFVFCLFLSPLASVIPSCATAPALIYVGVLMARNFAKVDMDDMLSAVPAFLALIMMPLTYSISNGIGIGAIAYVVIALFTGNYKKKDIVITVIAALFVCKFIFVTM